MKRPFCVIGFTMVTVLWCLSLFERTDLAFCGFFLFASAFIFASLNKNFRKNLTVPVGLFCGALSCLLFFSFYTDKAKVQAFDKEVVSLKATVCQAPYFKKSSGKNYAVADIVSINETKLNGKVRIYYSFKNETLEPANFEIGNTLSFNAKVYTTSNENSSISRYFTGKRIFIVAGIYDSLNVETPSHRPVTYYFAKLKKYINDRLLFSFDRETAGLLSAILTGDKGLLSQEIVTDFQRTSASHLLSVSGLHLSLWVMILSMAIKDTDRLRKPKNMLLIAAVVFIMLLAGMSESVTRAGFMALVHLISKCQKRTADSLNSLGIAVFLMVIFNPACVMSVSFQLSFLSTLSILTLAKHLIEGSRKVIRINSSFPFVKKTVTVLTESFCISLSVLIFTAPVLIYCFGGISSVSALTNAILIPISAPLLFCTGLYLILSFAKPIALPINFITTVLAKYVIYTIKFLSKLKNAFIPFEWEYALLYLAGVILITAICVILLKKHKGKRPLIAALSLAVSIVCILIFEMTYFFEKK